MKKEPPTVVELGKFDMSSIQWVIEKTRKFHVEKDKFSSGTFRYAFKASDIADGSKWFIKKYIPKAVKIMEDLGMALEDHVHNQVQLHSAAGNILISLIKRTYQKDLSKLHSPAGNDQGISSADFSAVPLQSLVKRFGFLNDVAVTVEEFIDSQMPNTLTMTVNIKRYY